MPFRAPDCSGEGPGAPDAASAWPDPGGQDRKASGSKISGVHAVHARCRGALRHPLVRVHGFQARHRHPRVLTRAASGTA